MRKARRQGTEYRKGVTAAIAFLALGLVTAFAAAPEALAAAADPFTPARVPATPGRAKLEVTPGRMAFVRGEFNGRPCTMLFDTGATHTTFNRAFLEREFPLIPMRGLVMGGGATTNVEQQPKIFHADSLKVGEAEFGDFMAIALDMPAFSFDVILGLNVIGSTRTIVSFGKGEVLFGLGKDAREGFSRPAKRKIDPLDPATILLTADCGKGEFTLFVDSGSTWTFLPGDCGWPATSNTVEFTARDINGAGTMRPLQGEKGVLKLSPACEIELSPLLSAEPLNRIGADTLLEYDMLIEPRAVAFRKNANATQAE